VIGATERTQPKGIRRSVELVRLFLRESTDPKPFYEFLARDTISQLEPYLPKSAQPLRFIDVGGGPGYLSEQIRQRGDQCFAVDYNESELTLHAREAKGVVVGDGCALPLRGASADVVHSSNVLEHVPHPEHMLDEMLRVLRPGGVGYLSYTPWLSPWGGHETSPWHLLGGDFAAQRYEKRTEHPAKNLYGESLFNLPLPQVRGWFQQRSDAEILWDGPRYWPTSWRFMSRLPVIGETITWNYMVIFRRR